MMPTVELTQKKLIIIALIWAATVIAPSTYFYRQYRSAQDLLSDSAAVTRQDIKDTAAKVGRFVELPTDETPNIATISDLSKVATQPFFAKASLGDKALIYSKAKLAVLYRPSSDTIVEIAPIGGGQ